MKSKILLLSGYDAASHKYWRNTLAGQLDAFEWTQLALPPRHFAWRTRGSSISLAFEYQKELHQQYDLIVATSMVDLASLRGFIPGLTETPTILYFHENQFVYPVSANQPNILNAQLTSLYAALCADYLWFNSAYNRDSFFDGALQLMKRMPDKVPGQLTGKLLPELKKSAAIMPVPVSLPDKTVGTHAAAKGVPEFVWNHRWEYDKQPEVFFRAMEQLKKHQIEFRLHVVGQSFRHLPDCFEQYRKFFEDEILSWGFQPRDKYFEILQQADFVVSTALHDFQGLSMIEAILCGCQPIAPARVVYPEYISTSGLYPVASDREIEANYLFEHICRMLEEEKPIKTEVKQFAADKLLVKYQKTFATYIGAK